MNTAVVLLALLSACVFCCRVLSFGYGAPASHHSTFECRQSNFCYRFAYHAIVSETAFATFICKRCAVVALLIFSFLSISLNFSSKLLMFFLNFDLNQLVPKLQILCLMLYTCADKLTPGHKNFNNHTVVIRTNC